MIEEIEIWKDCKGYEGIYSISSIGRVRRMPGKYAPKGRILRFNVINRYHVVKFSYLAIKKNQFVHRLVAEAFIPNPFNKPFINHIDCNPSNNHISNLEWCTQSENIQHAFKVGTKVGIRGEQRSKKLTNQQILEIRERKARGENAHVLAIEFGLSYFYIFKIAQRATWNHI